MICNNCGKKIDDKALKCPYCGTNAQIMDTKAHVPNTKAIWGIVIFIICVLDHLLLLKFLTIFTLFGAACFGIGGLIFSLGGLNDCRKNAEQRMALSITGIILNSLCIMIDFFLIVYSFLLTLQ